ncbi:hypothetical protein [Flindersiella endophytica]
MQAGVVALGPGATTAGLVAAARRGELAPGTVLVRTGGLPGVFGHPEVLAYADTLPA